MRLFDADGLLIKILSAITNIVEINLLWIICSLPIVTIGASTTAAYYVSMKVLKGEEGKVMNQFFAAFKDNFKQSTIIWVIYAVYGFLLANNFAYIKATKCDSKMYVIVTVFIAIIYLFLVLYTFPMIARYKNTLKNIVKNSLIVSIRYFPSTLLMILVLALLPFAFMTNRHTIVLIVIFGMGGFTYVSSYFLLRTFGKVEEAVGISEKESSGNE